jgi:acyl-homoserine lactone acylase PvdQ
VRPERTADGAALLLIDPHVPWDGPFRFYEFRMHAGGHDISGFGLTGTPFLGLGHNAFLGWACTTGGPDTTDIYVEQLDPANPKRYRYDDGWRELTSETLTLAVKDSPPVVRTLERSHHGPIALREGNKAFAIACPYLDQIDLATELYRAMTARNLAEFDAALAMCQLMEQNVMYADVDGNIRYVRTGRVPIRPSGFDFSKPVPGNTSKSEWLGIHPMKDLVQVLNPPCGYMQNCNIGPDMMARGLQLDLSKYPFYISGVGPGVTNSRGRRAVELLEAHPKLTIPEAMAIVLDTHADGCERWQAALRDAAKKADLDKPRAGADPAALRKAVETLLAWNGMMDQESVGATLYRGWRTFANERRVRVDGSPSALIDALAQMVAWLVKNYGTAEVAYGQVHRVRRGDHSWPVSGGESGGGSTLRAISAKLEGKVFYGQGGQNWTQLVQFRRGAVRSWSATPYGESDDPASPHYADQAEKLFSPGRLKPTWFQPAELEGNVVSTKVLRREQK